MNSNGLERALEIPQPSGQQFPSVLVPLSRVFTEVLHELVLVPIVIEEIVSMPVRVIEIGRTLPVSGFQHALSQLLPITYHESHVIHPGVKIRLVRSLLGSTSALDAQVGILRADMDPALCRATFSPALPSNAELRYRSQKESDSLIHICGRHIQVLQEWLHGILWANRTYVTIGREHPSATAIIPHRG